MIRLLSRMMDTVTLSETRREPIRGGSMPASMRATVSERVPESIMLPLC